MDTNEIQVKLTCECGNTLAARSKDAGGTVRCSCGRAVAVPKLSDLRRMAGADAYVTNPAEAIRKAQREGNDPAGTSCVQCKAGSARVYLCNATCESLHVKHLTNESTEFIRWLFLLPLIVNILIWFRKEESELSRGHDVEVSFRLPVCDSCAATVGNPTRPRVTKKLMMNVPAYRELLAYYPGIKLRVERPQ